MLKIRRFCSRGPGGLSSWVLILAMLSVALITVPARPATAATGPIGISLPYLDEAVALRVINDAADMGVDYVRLDVPGTIESAKGNFPWNLPDNPNNYYDVVINEIRRRGMSPLAILGYTPDWAHPGITDDKYPYNNPADYGDFARAVELHFGTRINHYELWNEPNIKEFWKPRPSPSAYATHFGHAVYALRSLGTSYVVTAGLAPAGGPSGSDYVRPHIFLNERTRPASSTTQTQSEPTRMRDPPARPVHTPTISSTTPTSCGTSWVYTTRAVSRSGPRSWA